LVLNEDYLAVHEVADGQAFAQRVVYAVQPSLAQAGEVERGLAQRFGGDGAGVDAGAAEVGGGLDQRHALAVVGGLGGALLAGWARANHDEVEVGGHDYSSYSRRTPQGNARPCRGYLSPWRPAILGVLPQVPMSPGG